MLGEQLASKTPVRIALLHLPALDGVRGLAVLLVLLDHASDAGMRLFAAADLNRAGKYGVYLFFVLSAFLLTYQFCTRKPAELARGAVWMNYMVRRFFRIYPLYLFVLVAMVFMGKRQWEDVFTHLLLRDGTGHFWTIPVEFKYYLVLPLLVLPILWGFRKSGAWGTVTSLISAALLAVFFLAERAWSMEPEILLWWSLAPFLLGSIAAFAHWTMHRNPARFRRFAVAFEVAAAAAAITLVFRLPGVFNPLFSRADPVSKFAYDPLVCGMLWTIFLLGVLHGSGLMRRALEWPPLRYLGLISFSAYLWHKKFITDVDDLPVPPQVRLLAFLAIVIGISTASYFLIERPLSRLRWKSGHVVPRREKDSDLPAPAPI
jgi:peptidoglycan/LPS O-acetylase OafA/YrhL